MSVFFGLDTEAYDRQYSDQELLRRILRFFAPHRRRVIIVGTLIAILSLLGAAQPIVVSRGLDLLVQSPTLDLRLALVAIVLVIGVANWAGNWLRRRVTVRIIGAVVLTLRRDAFHASMHHDMSFFDEFQSGRIISRITSDTEEFSQVVLLVTDLIGQVLVVFILAVALFTVSWQLTLTLLALVLLLVIILQENLWVTQRHRQKKCNDAHHHYHHRSMIEEPPYETPLI